MARYIDKDKLIKGGWRLIREAPDGRILTVMSMADVPDEKDVVEVKHGKWIREDETQALLSVLYHCDKCEIPLEMNGIYTPIGAGYNYCPNCGANMDK